MENLETILSEMTENQLTQEDQLKIKEILSKYSVNNQNVSVDERVEEGFELPNNDWEEPLDLDFDFLSQNSEQHDSINETNNNTIHEEKNVLPIIQMDEYGQLQLPLEQSIQMELDLSINQPEVSPPQVQLEKVGSEKVESVTAKNEQVLGEDYSTPTDNLTNLNIADSNGRKEPVLNFDGLDSVVAQNIAIETPSMDATMFKFKSFEALGNNSLGKLNNLFNFRDENGKIDWYNKAQKTVLVLGNIKNAALDNKVVNTLKSMVVKKYNNSKFGIRTNQIADTITVNLMSREERYNREFKNTVALLGYDVQELIKPTNEPMLTLQDVSDNVNNSLKKQLGLELTNHGYEATLLKELNDEQKVKFIQNIMWPKLTEMMGESIKLFEALKDIKQKNPLTKEIAHLAKKNDMEEDLLATMLLKSPELLKQKGIKGLDKLLARKEDIENLYFKNEELYGKNFIVIQNLIKATNSIQKTIIGLDISKEHKEAILKDIKTTVVKSDNKKSVLLENIQDSVTSSLQDNQFVKSLREINDTILKIRNSKTKDVKLKM